MTEITVNTVDFAPHPHACGAPNFPQLLGKAAWGRLAAPIRARFGPGTRAIAWRGQAELHANWFGRLVAIACIPLGRPLPTLHGHVVAEIGYVARENGAAWLRRYISPDQMGEAVCSTKRVDKTGALRECAGPVEMRLTVTEEDGALVFTSNRFFLRLGALDLPLPAWATPGRFRVVHRDLGPAGFSLTLTARHPWFGTTFDQHAVFPATPLKGGLS